MLVWPFVFSTHIFAIILLSHAFQSQTSSSNRSFHFFGRTCVTTLRTYYPIFPPNSAISVQFSNHSRAFLPSKLVLNTLEIINEQLLIRSPLHPRVLQGCKQKIEMKEKKNCVSSCTEAFVTRICFQQFTEQALLYMKKKKIINK